MVVRKVLEDAMTRANDSNFQGNFKKVQLGVKRDHLYDSLTQKAHQT